MSRMRLRFGAQGRPTRDRPSSGRCVILAVAAGIGIVSGWVGSATAADAPRLLLLPVVVHSAEAPEYLRDGLADMLAARFSRIGSIELVRPTAEEPGTTDHERAVALGQKAGADYVLFGSFTRFGQGASLDVQCAPVSADKQREPLREIFVHSGSIGEIIPDLDELAGKVSRFARGEAISPGAPTASGATLADEARAASSLDDLAYRIEALEAALTELLEADTSGVIEAETNEELR
jgi:TolB-like protein